MNVIDLATVRAQQDSRRCVQNIINGNVTDAARQLQEEPSKVFVLLVLFDLVHSGWRPQQEDVELRYEEAIPFLARLLTRELP